MATYALTPQLHDLGGRRERAEVRHEARPKAKSARRNLAPLFASLVLHGGLAAYAAYGAGRSQPETRLVDIDVVETAAPLVIVPPEPKPEPKPVPNPETKLEPRTVTARPALQRAAPPPPLPPPAAGIQPDTVVREAESTLVVGSPNSVPDVHGEAQGDGRGVAGGAVGGASAGVVGAAPAERPLPVVAPSYDAAYLKNAPPRYPAIARRMRLEGTTTVRVLVDADGHPERVGLESSSGASVLDSAAVLAVEHWTFIPARKGETNVPAEVIVPLRFRLAELTAE